MKRRAAAAGPREPFPEHLLDVPLPLSPADRALVDAACEAAGLSPIGYLQLRVIRKRARLAAGAGKGDVGWIR